jgi:hypothetical protein
MAFDEKNIEFRDAQIKDIRSLVYAHVERAILNSCFKAAILEIVKDLAISERRKLRKTKLRMTRFL